MLQCGKSVMAMVFALAHDGCHARPMYTSPGRSSVCIFKRAFYNDCDEVTELRSLRTMYGLNWRILLFDETAGAVDGATNTDS